MVEENNLNQNISTLRRVFGERPGEQRFIVTIAGHGYRFVSDVRPILDFGVGGANTKPAETVSAPEDESSKLRLQSKNWKKIEVACYCCGVELFNSWRSRKKVRHGDEKSVDGPIKTMAVLPFKPLVLENRNEALEEIGIARNIDFKVSETGEVVVPSPECDSPI